MNAQAKPVGPLLIAHLFPKIEALLLDLLRALTPEDWEKQTLARKWKVKDVVAHLLDTQLRKLSLARDGWAANPEVLPAPAHLVALINRLNEEGVTFYRRLSPAVLISLMATASRESAAYHQSLDPFAPAKFAVSWAGEETSLNWFDTAREYTERWHHQQQIRLAVNLPGIMTPELYHPVLDCFLRGLPNAYRDRPADSGTVLQVEVAGDCGGTWYLYRDGRSWRLVEASLGPPSSRVTIPQAIAWRIFTKGIERAAAAAQLQVVGDRELGLHLLGMKAIVG